MGLLAAGFILSVVIGLLGYWRSSLSAGGVFGAILTGTVIFGLGGLAPGLALVAFFVSSSALSRFRLQAKGRFEDKFQKGGRRDLGQALANGGWAAILVIAAYYYPSAVLLAAVTGSLAAVTADTWATEVGVLGRRSPRLITTGRRVVQGTSGGITEAGTLASLAGALFIGLTAALVLALSSFARLDWLEPLRRPNGAAELVGLVLIAGIAGLGGSLFDSLLGASVQGIYICDACGVETERKVHKCGSQTRLLRGLALVDNDLVNFAASIFGSVAAAGTWLVVFGL